MWDVDGNEYVDLAMGFGALLFGHRPDFLIEALMEQIERGIHIGPQSDGAGKTAELLCEPTGMERAGFCVTGAEAVMMAIRLARTATGRTKLGIFEGSYHGHYDGTQAIAESDDPLRSSCMVPGIPQSAAFDTVVLQYGDPSALDLLAGRMHEFAAVLVEPVQQNRPDLQPRGFLHRLRALTAENGTALIFDEVLLGFRPHIGGAQAWFEVPADIATYGKVVGGGLPVGVVAGSAAFFGRAGRRCLELR